MSSKKSDLGQAASPVRLLISVCELRDIDVWKIASDRIIRHIPADEYLLICPDPQIPDFKHATAKGWRIDGESNFTANCPLDLIRRNVTGANVSRTHWLFQQFIKINAILKYELDDQDLVLIWDADTVPLRRIGFGGEASGAVGCYSGKERHQPYFDLIAKLLGSGETMQKSFIAQCLPVRVGWVRALVREIEGRFGVPYVEAVLALLPGASGSEFSEYETIGTWVVRHFPGALVFKKKNRWLRSGPQLFGDHPAGVRAKCLLWLLAFRYDFVAIEKWSRKVDFERIKNALTRALGSERSRNH